MTESTSETVFEMFCDACEHGNLDQVQRMLPSIEIDSLSQCSLRNGFNCPPLTIAACSKQSNNSLEVVRFLLDNGADTAVVDERRFNVLHHAASAGAAVDVLQLLIKHGADVNAKTFFGNSVVECASNNADALRLLWRHGADEGDVLIAATMGGHVAVVREMIVHGVDIDPVDAATNATPLWFAEVQQNVALVRLLLAHGAQPLTIPSNSNWSALACAIYSHMCVADYIAAGVDVCAPCCGDGRLPLFMALEYTLVRDIALILAAGADLNVTDINGTQPLQAALSEMSRTLLVCSGASDNSSQYSRQELAAAQAELTAAKATIEHARQLHVAERRRIVLARHALVVEIALPVCFALQNLRFPAYVTLAILDELLPARVRDLVTMHFKWELITAIKHYRERISDETRQKQAKMKTTQI